MADTSREVMSEHTPSFAGPNDRMVICYRQAGRHLAQYLGLDANVGQAAATELVSEGHLPRSYGRSYVAPTLSGLMMLAITIIARAGGLSRGDAANMAIHGERENLDPASATVHAGRVSLRVGTGYLIIGTPAGLRDELHRMEALGRCHG